MNGVKKISMFHLHPAFSFSHWYCMCAQIVLKTRVLYQTEKSMQRYAFFTRINCHSLSASFFGRRRRRRTVFLFWLELRLLLVRFFCVYKCVWLCVRFFFGLISLFYILFLAYAACERFETVARYRCVCLLIYFILLYEFDVFLSLNHWNMFAITTSSLRALQQFSLIPENRISYTQ